MCSEQLRYCNSTRPAEVGRNIGQSCPLGANSINGIDFDVLDKSEAQSEACRLAIESAR